MKIKDYFESVIKESKAIVFPPRKRVVADSTIVVASLVLGGALIGFLDLGLTAGMEQIILLMQK